MSQEHRNEERQLAESICLLAVAVENLAESQKHNNQILHRIEHIEIKLMTALETLTASVNANTVADGELTTAVNAAIVQLGTASPTDAQLLTLAGQIDANTATTAAQTVALNAAVTPPAVPPTT